MVRMVAACLFFFSSTIAWCSGCSGDEMPKGWCYPTGSVSGWNGDYLEWHGMNPNYAGLHLGRDIKAAQGNPVYATADGTVLITRMNVGGYGGVGSAGGGMIIRHITADGKSVDVLYAHIKNMAYAKGHVVMRGQRIADVGPYTEGKEHLHFAISFPSRSDSFYFGNGTNPIWIGYASTDEGFVDPERFLFLVQTRHS